MPLTSGTRMGSYEVITSLGAGGMGEVYRARDTKLGRTVAIKVVSEAFVSDPDRIARFDREAKLLASLNHQNIAALYGMEESQGRHFLVMELVEGETLADRLKRGPLSLADTLAVAHQMAEALEAAHERGVVHRDLKPANIKVTPDERVKVLDFGLAKALETEATAAANTNSPTLSMRATQIGVILGTAAYMSPEQAKGLPADHRSDIFSFGVVLFEMLTGRQPFSGETAADVLASVLVRDVDLSALPASLDPRVRELVRRCLEKQPKQRWQAIGDVRAEVETIRSSPASAQLSAVTTAPALRATWQLAAAVLVAAVIGAGMTYLAMSRLRSPAPRPAIVKFSLTMPEGQPFSGVGRRFVAIAPDGSRIAYFLNGRLLVRSFSDLETRPLPGVEIALQASSPAFSPDSQSIVYWASDRTIKRVGIAGGVPMTLCAADGNPYGVSWGPSAILFTQSTGQPDRISRVPDTGGQPQPLVTGIAGEVFEGPQMLPDGETLLFTVNTSAPSPESWDRAAIVAYSLKTGQRKTLVSGGSDGRYLPTGHLIYSIGGTLYAIGFDVRKLETIGQAVAVLEGVRRVTAGASGGTQLSVSSNGSLIYVPGPPGLSASRFDLILSDRQGHIEPLGVSGGAYEYPRVSPDGKSIAFGTDNGKTAEIFVYPLAGTRPESRLTFGGRNRFPVWTGDGQRIAFQSDREGDLAIWSQRADGTGTAERLTKAEPETAHIPDSWSRSAELLAFTVANKSTFSVWTYSTKTHTSTEFDSIKSYARPTAALSPDGKWMAYSFAESTTNSTQIYVQPVPPTGARYQLNAKAADNPHHPAWSPDGKELFYIPRVGGFEVVSVVTAPTFAFGNPTQVPRPFPTAAPTTPRTFDLVPPGGKFVSVAISGQTATPGAGSSTIHVVLNWFEELKTRVPVGK